MGGYASYTFGDCCIFKASDKNTLSQDTQKSFPESLKMTNELDGYSNGHHESGFKDFDEAYKVFCEYYNEKFDEGYEEMMMHYGCRVYAKDYDDGIIVKADWLSNIEAETLVSYFKNPEKRLKWDNNIEEMKTISRYEDIEVTHIIFKKKFAISQRDMVLASKVFKKNGVSLVSVSAENNETSSYSKVIRVNARLAGIHALPIKVDNYGNVTKVFLMLQADFGGSVPRSIVKKMISSCIPNIVSSLDRHISDSLY